MPSSNSSIKIRRRTIFPKKRFRILNSFRKRLKEFFIHWKKFRKRFSTHIFKKIDSRTCLQFELILLKLKLAHLTWGHVVKNDSSRQIFVNITKKWRKVLKKGGGGCVWKSRMEYKHHYLWNHNITYSSKGSITLWEIVIASGSWWRWTCSHRSWDLEGIFCYWRQLCTLTVLI